MQRLPPVIIFVVAQMAVTAASLPARADAGPGAIRRLAHRAAGHARSRHLTVRRHAGRPVAVTRDFDPVPPDPLVVGFFRGLEGAAVDARAYAPLDLDQPFGPRVFRDF